MGIFDGILICSDIDGTLKSSDGSLSVENERAIRDFQGKGGRFTVATGRYPQHMQVFGDRLTPNAPLICVNGTVLYDAATASVVYACPMDGSIYEVLAFVERECRYVTSVYLGEDLRGEVCYRRQPDRTFGFIQTDVPIYKAVLCMDAAFGDQCKALLVETFGKRFDFDRSWSEGLEIHRKGSGKGDALTQMRRLFPSVHTIVAVGDYENDVSMLSAADIGYAVENALPCVKAVADRITVSNDEAALAHIIEDLSR